MNFSNSIESPLKVHRTQHLAHFVHFLPLSLLEVQRKSSGLVSLASPMFFCFKVTSPDFHQTWTRQAAEFGQVQRIPLEVRQAVQWVRWNWLGLVKVRWNPLERRGECKAHDKSMTIDPWLSRVKRKGWLHIIHTSRWLGTARISRSYFMGWAVGKNSVETLTGQQRQQG